MQNLLLLAVLAAACNYTAVPTGPFTNVFDLLRGKQGPVFVLCLDNSTAEKGFSMGRVSVLSIPHLTIQ